MDCPTNPILATKRREASDAADIEAYNHAERELANYQAMLKIKY